MKKQTYISPAITICHCATATMLAASPEKNTNMGTDQEPGDFEFQSKPHDVNLWTDDDIDKEEKKSNLYWQI